MNDTIYCESVYRFCADFAPGDTGYHLTLKLTTAPVCFLLHTTDGSCCAIRVTQIRIASEDIRIQAWFPKVKGLRLVRH